MADESGASGLAKGITRSLRSRMWAGASWAEPGDIIAGWLMTVIRSTQHTCPYCQHEIALAIERAIEAGPSAEDMEPYVTREAT